MFNPTFNNISVILQQSVLLLEETGEPEKTTNLSEDTDKLFPTTMQSRPRHPSVIFLILNAETVLRRNVPKLFPCLALT